ncbi:type IV toxin-antitoxin system AbiEi family antitoxin [Flavobacterium sp. NG2]|uniref:type IV toxin-antitoxin system AbiEi family antitoxin n=1 Tax=Flavobacterium sp. NG2 TaxID=3097547 RepID=UPI002A7FBA95|nr:type IV toxin-antitoxin system AbiEi family antitoxin [Flavobacterium sp. NG2]WPR73075.1 type IV toxin-antitoxin system AbiEi family antitoxin [Flavobacterium sp. NG2]
MNEIDILNNAIHNLEKNIPINWDWKTLDYKEQKEIDGELAIIVNNQKVTLFVEIKKDVKNHQLFNILNYKNKFTNFLLVAEKLYPKVKKELRENRVNYLEGNGNVYINTDDLFLYIDTNEVAKTQKEKGNRAFTKTGLKVIFQFLLNPKLINQTQREIAEVTNVALGNIPLIINGLLETNLIVRLNKNEYVINNYEELLNKWITEFEQTLKPTLFKQRFRYQNKDKDWRTIPLNTDKTVWGGEPAGDILTNHLRPEKFTIYTKETTKELILNYKLLPDDEGEITVYDMFWNNEYNTNTAPNELVYTDLMITDDKRCKETAKLIFNEHIQPNL